MKKYFFIHFLLLLTLTSYTQEKSTAFFKDFLGVYKGTLVITSENNTKEVPMEFHLTKTDRIHRYNYVILYDKQPRNYTLIVKDFEKGILEIDENNGIVLPVKLANNTLHSFFEVQGNFLSTRFAFFENTLNFEILFTSTKKKTTTGKGTKEIPFVYGFPISVVQKAVLKKEKS